MTAPSILSHRRAPGSPSDGTHRWRVELQDARALDVELPSDERASLELSDDELHGLLPTALARHAAARMRDDDLAGDQVIAWDTPVRLYADHFRG